MEKKIKKYIKEKSLIPPGSRVLLALSGGKDSVFLFHMLNKFKDEMGYELLAAHINHMLRQKDSENDEMFVKKLCCESGIKLFTVRQNVKKYAGENKLSEEEAGRKIRYDFLYKTAKENSANLIATAHNMDDQAETVLLKIIRGTGTEGLSGIRNENMLIRPIINITKEEILKYLQENKIDYCRDKTNEVPIYLRNKVRLELIPLLEKDYNRNIVASLKRLSENMQADNQIIDEYVKMKFKEAASVFERKVEIDLEKFNSFSEGIKNRIIREAFNCLCKLYNLEKKHVELIIKLSSEKKTGKRLNLQDNTIAQICYDSLIIQKTETKKAGFLYKLTPGESVCLGETATTLVSKLWSGSMSCNNEKKKIFVDLNKVKGSIIIRNRRTGDAFSPTGMNGSKKIKDYFIDEKVPREARDKVPIVVCDSGIIWVAGFRMSRQFKADKNTDKILMMEIIE